VIVVITVPLCSCGEVLLWNIPKLHEAQSTYADCAVLTFSLTRHRQFAIHEHSTVLKVRRVPLFTDPLQSASQTISSVSTCPLHRQLHLLRSSSSTSCHEAQEASHDPSLADHPQYESFIAIQHTQSRQVHLACIDVLC
jgi:hypothetical protein